MDIHTHSLTTIKGSIEHSKKTMVLLREKFERWIILLFRILDWTSSHYFCGFMLNTGNILTIYKQFPNRTLKDHHDYEMCEHIIE